jgi:hypothetical protein
MAAGLPLVCVARGILPGLRLLDRSVNTAPFERNGEKLLIDSGEQEAVPGGAEWLLFTHHPPD